MPPVILVRHVMRKLRYAAGLSQKQMGATVGKTHWTVARWEKGYIPPTDAMLLYRVWLKENPGLVVQLTPEERHALWERGLL